MTFTIVRFLRADLGALAVAAVASLVAGAVAVLCGARGGVDSAVSTAVFGSVLAVSGFLVLCESRTGLDFMLTWPVMAIVLLPLAQLMPLGPVRGFLWPSWRLDLSRAFSELGVEPGSTASLYPYTTLRASIVLTGCCVLFAAARAVARQRGRALMFAVAAIVVSAVIEAGLGLHQALFATGEWTINAIRNATAHGTFVNRNHFAVLLEAGLCLAAGLYGSLRNRESAAVGAATRRWLLAGTSLAAALCVAGVGVSGSRMGLFLVAIAVPAGVFWLFPKRDSRPALLAMFLGGAALTAALSFSNTRGFEVLWRQGGDPGRLSIWQDALRAAARHGLTGSGLGTFSYAFQRGQMYFPRNAVDHAHNDWLELLVELGLPGACLLVAAIGVVLARAGGQCRRMGAGRWSSLQAAATLAAFVMCLHAMVDFPLKIPALAALFAVLLGTSAGLGREQPKRSRCPKSFAVAGCWGFALAAVAMPGVRDAECSYLRGQHQLLNGRGIAADASFREALQANPFLAGAWIRRSEAAEMSGDPDKAGAFLEIAGRVEPHTFWTTWPAAQWLLRQQRWNEAAGKMRPLLEALPEFQDSLLRSAVRAGMPVGLITAEVVPANAVSTWLRVLADDEQWSELENSASRCSANASVCRGQDLRYVFDRLFQARRQRLMEVLWGELASRELRQPLKIELPGDAFGFRWILKREAGVFVDAPAGSHLAIDLRKPRGGESVLLSHYFTATPEGRNTFSLSSRTEAVGGGELWLEVWSAERLVGRALIPRSAAWRPLEVAFRTGAAEEVLQLRVVSREGKSQRAVSGRYFFRDFVFRGGDTHTGS